MNKETMVAILKGFHSNTIWTNSFPFFLFKNCITDFLDRYVPKFHNYPFIIPKGSSLHQTASFDIVCAKISSRVWTVALLKNKKQKHNKLQNPYMLSPCGVSTAHRIRTNFVSGDLHNVITYAKVEIN